MSRASFHLFCLLLKSFSEQTLPSFEEEKRMEREGNSTQICFFALFLSLPLFSLSVTILSLSLSLAADRIELRIGAITLSFSALILFR